MHCRRTTGLGSMGSGTPSAHHQSAGGWGLYTATMMGVVGSGTPLVHCLAASLLCTKWAKGLLEYTHTLLGGSGHWDSFSAPPQCWGVVGNGTLPVHRHSAGKC